MSAPGKRRPGAGEAEGPLPPSPPARLATSDQIGEFLRAHGKRVLTFVGYSASGYEDPAALLKIAAQVLAACAPAHTWVNIGATAAGIGAIYPLARQLGFGTLGIVSTRAREQAGALSPAVDQVFFVADGQWGGRVDGSTRLSPTSAAIVEHSDELVAIGGSRVAADELMAARAAGKSVRFMAADMNHRLALQWAAARGAPPPVDFRGAAHAAWLAADPVAK